MFSLKFIPCFFRRSANLSHLNIGAGRIVWQDIVRIDVAIKKRQFHKNETILESFKHAKETNGRLHFVGLVRIASITIAALSILIQSM